MVKDMFTYISLNFEKLGYFNLLHKVTLECAPSFLAFLKFRGLWRLLECSFASRSGDSISNRKFFSDMKREGESITLTSPSLPLPLSVRPLDSTQKHLRAAAPQRVAAQLRRRPSSTQSSLTVSHFQTRTSRGEWTNSPLQYSSD